VTATDTGQESADVLAERLRDIDRRLDALAELVGSTDADVASAPILREVEALSTELRQARALVDLAGHDDPFDSAAVAVSVRQERLGFIRAALVPGAAPEPLVAVAAAVPPPPPPKAAVGTEGQRASSVGRVFSIVGLVIVGFFVYQLTGSALVHARSQRILLQEFKEKAPLQAADPADTGGGDASTDGLLTPGEASGEEVDPADAEPEVIQAAEPPARGEPIGIIQIPDLDVEQVIVQGTGPAELRAGPGHLRGTSMPGEPGNAAIAGSRVSNGAPFRELDRLDEGDRIEVTTAVGRFRYEVRSVRRVRAGQPDPVRATGGGSTLTLVTSTPAFLAYDRLVVVSELQTRPVAPRFAPVTPDRTQTGLDASGAGFAPVVGWGAALGLAIWAARLIYRRWPTSVSYLITTPILVALVLLVFESLSGLLPATF
jgi:sortase A